MRARVNGPFRVYDHTGQDITPLGMKERGLLALLLLSPGQRRTRVWLQDKLWSDRGPSQASGSLRQALSNVKKALGTSGDILCADRSTLWLQPEMQLDLSAQGELLDDIDVRDPEFTDWLRDQRMAQPQPAAPALTQPNPDTALLADRARPMIILRQTDFGSAPHSRFLTRAIGQRIVGDLILVGEIDVVQLQAQDQMVAESKPSALIELESFGEGETSHMLFRLIALPSRRVAWSGRLSLGLTIQAVWQSPEVTRTVNQLVHKVCDLLASLPASTPHSAFHRAIRRIYEFDREGLHKSDQILATLQDGEFRGLALAWRSFIRLTSALEFRDTGPEAIEQSTAFADEALRALADHPVVLSLASQVQLKLRGDLDAAHYLALRAAEISDQNPYALQALSQTLILHGNFDQANDLAQRARLAAQGLSNSFNWDMHACLTTISLGQLDEAILAAVEAHRKMPFYRPALRYLVALSYLTGNRSNAEYYTGRLQRLEPDFTPSLLLQPSYPLETLRALGYMEMLRPFLS